MPSAPANTPAEIVDNFNAAIRQVLKADEVKAGLAKLPSKSDTEPWAQVVKGSPLAQASAMENVAQGSVAVEAVSCEPVSGANSLLTGKLTGNFSILGPSRRFWRPVGEQIQ